MTVEQLTKISDANLAIARLQEKIEQERGVLSGILRECDHLNPDGSSAVRTGLPGTSCRICRCNNDYGCLDEHLHKHHGCKMPARDEYGMILEWTQ